MDKLKLQHNAIIKAVETTKEGVLIIKGVASMYRTPEGFLQIDRDNELVNLDFMDLDSYKKNPILVFQHDWSRPMGKVTALEHRDGSLHITAEVHKLTGEENIYEAVQKGIVKSLSISTVPHSYVYRDMHDGDILEIESSTLVEISLTTVQSNQEALFDVVAEKSPTISKKLLAAQNDMTCDELDGSCAFKAELKGKSINTEKGNNMSVIKKEVAAAKPEAKEEPKAVEPKVIEPEPKVIEPEVNAVEPEVKAVEPEVKQKPAPAFDEVALVAAIEKAEAEKIRLADEKAEADIQAAKEHEIQEVAAAKAKIDNAVSYIKDRQAEILAISDEDFDTDDVEEFYELVSDAAEAIEGKIAGIINPQPVA